MSATGPTRDWDAETYDRVSDPMVALGAEVLARLPLTGDETVLDAGCGSGRVTALLLERLPRGHVIAVDAAPSMVALARQALPRERATVLGADLCELSLPRPVDAVLSTATFHWIADHERLFGRLHAALRPGGRLEAQCGGGANVARLHAVARKVAAGPRFRAALADWSGPWNFASAEQTAARLRAAGFAEVETWLQPREVRPSQPRDYLETICLGAHLERLPPADRDAFRDAVLDAAGTPLRVDYVRLNISARRPS